MADQFIVSVTRLLSRLLAPGVDKAEQLSQYIDFEPGNNDLKVNWSSFGQDEDVKKQLDAAKF